jgi:membrane associated rhomboid family serine protease
MVGASGAVFGVLMAFGMLFPNTVLYLLFPPIPVKAKYLVMFYGAYEIYSEINRSVGDNVAHFAHLSGMLIAFIILKYWQQKSGDFY